MGHVMEPWLSCYLVLLSTDSKPGIVTTQPPFRDLTHIVKQLCWMCHPVWIYFNKFLMLRSHNLNSGACFYIYFPSVLSHRWFQWTVRHYALSRTIAGSLVMGFIEHVENSHQIVTNIFSQENAFKLSSANMAAILLWSQCVKPFASFQFSDPTKLAKVSFLGKPK